MCENIMNMHEFYKSMIYFPLVTTSPYVSRPHFSYIHIEMQLFYEAHNFKTSAMDPTRIHLFMVIHMSSGYYL